MNLFFTSHSLYTLRPEIGQISAVRNHYSYKIYSHIYIITDLDNLDIFDTVIEKLSNPSFIDCDTYRNNPIPKLYFIIIRPEYANKIGIKLIKNKYMKMCKEANLPEGKYSVQCHKEIQFRYGDNYIRIANIPNTKLADYIMYNDYIGRNKDDRTDLIRVAGIETDSIVDGPGFRLTVFLQGCPHHCYKCQNPQTWDYAGGKFMTIHQIAQKFKENPMLQGITLSGGDPFMQARTAAKLIKYIKQISEQNNREIDIVTYTGYTLDELIDIIITTYPDPDIIHQARTYKELMEQTDYIVDGKFDYTKKSMSCKFRGSTNQRFLKISMSEGKVTEVEELYK